MNNFKESLKYFIMESDNITLQANIQHTAYNKKYTICMCLRKMYSNFSNVHYLLLEMRDTRLDSYGSIQGFAPISLSFKKDDEDSSNLIYSSLASIILGILFSYTKEIVDIKDTILSGGINIEELFEKCIIVKDIEEFTDNDISELDGVFLNEIKGIKFIVPFLMNTLQKTDCVKVKILFIPKDENANTVSFTVTQSCNYVIGNKHDFIINFSNGDDLYIHSDSDHSMLSVAAKFDDCINTLKDIFMKENNLNNIADMPAKIVIITIKDMEAEIEKYI